eukprot:TRINITY_DN32830_c0_g1_i1.p1 TRINITY_DN32830_c0_g1~~TRINITY_DN32830_c0_g1_i1.p1  ORF type:complete len:441 (+),score=51.06 TRINITY_DN32830_c0_g1_i1:61-1383(+)
MAPHEPLLQVTSSDQNPQPRWKELTTACYIPSALSFFSYGLGLLAFPLICQSWHLPVVTVSYLKTIAELAETAFSFPASTVAIRYGAKGSLLLGSFGFTLSTFGLAAVSNFSSLAACYFVQSGAIKIFNRGRSIIMKDVPNGFYGRVNGYLILLRCIFMSVAPVALSLLLSTIENIQHVFLLQSLLGLMMMVSISVDCKASDPGPHHKAPKSQEPGGKLAEKRDCVYYRDMFTGDCQAVLLRTVGLCSCISMLIGAYNILLPVASIGCAIPISQISACMTLCYGIAGLFSMLGGNMVDKLGRRTTMAAAMLLLASGHLCLGMLSALTVTNHCKVPVLVAAAVLFGLGDSIASPLRGVLKNGNADCVKKWAREHNRNEKAAIAKSFALLDVLLDLVGVSYPIALGLCATYFSSGLTYASVAFSMLGVLAALWAWCSGEKLN